MATGGNATSATWFDYIGRSASYLAVGIAIVVGLGSNIAALRFEDFLRGPEQRQAEGDEMQAQAIQRLRTEFLALRVEQRQIGASLRNLSSEAGVTVQSRVLRSRLETLETRQNRLEQVILSDPEKALALPLLRRDIQNIRDSNAESLEAVRHGMDQVYDTNKWLLGALAIGILALAISNIFTKKEKSGG